MPGNHARVYISHHNESKVENHVGVAGRTPSSAPNRDIKQQNSPESSLACAEDLKACARWCACTMPHAKTTMKWATGDKMVKYVLYSGARIRKGELANTEFFYRENQLVTYHVNLQGGFYT
jgi:hypothetical protein